MTYINRTKHLLAGASPLTYAFVDTAKTEEKRLSGLGVTAQALVNMYISLRNVHKGVAEYFGKIPNLSGTIGTISGSGRLEVARPNSFIYSNRSEGKIVRTVVLEPMAARFAYGNSGDNWAERKAKIENLMSTLAGEPFKFSNQYVLDESGRPNIGTGLKISLPINTVIRSLKSEQINPTITDGSKEWFRHIKMNMEIHFVSNVYRREVGEIDEKSPQTVSATIAVTFEITYPYADACYMLSCEDEPENFSLYDFLQHLAPIEANAFGLRELEGITVRSALAPDRYDRSMAVRQTMSNLDKLQKMVNMSVPPRQNEDGFTIHVSGDVFKTNYPTQLDEFFEATRNLYDRETRSFSRDPDARLGIFNKVLAIDWQGNVIIYTNTFGRYEFIDLKGSMPLSDISIGQHIQSYPLTSKHARDIVRYGRNVGINFDEDMLTSFTPEEFNDVNFQFADDDKRRRKYTAYIVKDTGAKLASLYENWDNIPIPISIRIKLSYYVKLYGFYARPENASKYVRAMREEVNLYREDMPTIEGPMTARGLSNLTHMPPHHKRILGDMTQRIPKNAILSVKAGGGKCLDYFTEIPSSKGILPIGCMYDMAEGGEETRKLDSEVNAFGETANSSGLYKSKGRTLIVKFASGKILEGLPEHRLWAWNKNKFDWMRLDELSKNTLLPRYAANIWPKTSYKFDQFNNAMPIEMSVSLARWIGLVISKGNCQRDRVQFTDTDPALLTEFRDLSEKLFNLICHRKEDNRGKNIVTTLQLHSRELTTWLDDNQISMARNGNLVVPMCIRMSKFEHQAAFVSALWDGDGAFYQKMDANREPRWSNEYTSASPDIIAYMSAFFDNADIEHRVDWRSHRERANVCGDINTYPRIYVDYKNAGKVLEVLNLKHSEKKTNLQKWAERAEAAKGSFSAMDTAPGAKYVEILRKRISATAPVTGLNVQKMLSITGTTYTDWQNSREFKHSRLHAVVNGLNSLPAKILKSLIEDKLAARCINKLRQLAEYRYDRIVSVVRGKVKPVYDMMVPGPEAYAVSGVMSHNTVLYLFEITDLLSRKIIKRPAVICPDGLRPNVARETYHFSDHNVRVFTLDRSHYDRMVKGNEALFKENPYAMFDILIDAQPANTVFLIDYGLLRLRPISIRVGNKEIDTYPFAVWLSQKFDYIVADESHKVKNVDSQISESFKVATPYAKFKRIASGTVVHNTPSDIYGQVNVFGPDILAPARHIIANKNIKDLDPDSIKLVLELIGRRVKQYNADTYEWSFLLPKINEQLHSVSMSALQKTFYDDLFDGIMKDLESDKKLLGMIQKGDADDDIEDTIVAQLTTAFSPLEIFINSPGGDSDYSQQFKKVRGVTPKDLVSNKVAYIDDKIIGPHLASGNPGKVLVLSTNLEISKHFYANSKHRKIAMHYTSEGQKEGDLIEKFKEDPNIQIMFADETTLKEGHNLQVCSIVVRAQNVWTPGDFLQALARVVRPEYPDAEGKLKYDRKSIDFHWVIFAPSLEVTKMCRLYAKIIKSAMIDRYATEPKFKNWADGGVVAGHKEYNGDLANYAPVKKLIEDAQQLKMNLQKIRDFQNIDSLDNYNRLYERYTLWMDNEFSEYKEEFRRQAAKKLGVDPSEISDTRLRVAAMNKVEHAPMDIPAEKAEYGKGYLPFLTNVAPKDTVGFGLEPIMKVMEKSFNPDVNLDANNNDAAEEDGEIDLPFDLGDLVVTEYGYGKIGRINPKGRSLGVDIKDLPRLTIPMSQVLMPTTDNGKNKLKAYVEALERTGQPLNIIGMNRDGEPVINNITAKIGDIQAGKPSNKPQTPKNNVQVVIDRIRTNPQSAPKPSPNILKPPVSPVDAIRRQIAQGIKPTTPVIPRPNIKPATPAAATTPTGKVPVPKIPVQGTKPTTPVIPKPGVKPDIKAPASRVDAEFLVASMFGAPCIVCFDENAKGKEIPNASNLLNHGFKRIPTMLTTEIKTWRGLSKLLKYFDDEGYQIPDEFRQRLFTVLKTFRENPNRMDKILFEAQDIRDFFIDNRKTIKNKRELHPYPVIIDDKLSIAVNAVVSEAARKLFKKRPVPEITMFERDAPYYVKFYKTKKALWNDALKLEDEGKIDIQNNDTFIYLYEKLG